MVQYACRGGMKPIISPEFTSDVLKSGPNGYAFRMELLVAPITELRPRLTHTFEETVAGTLDRGGGASPQPHTFTCGLTGGSAALIFLGALREAHIDWSRVTLFWGDERAVPPESPESNYGLVEQMLLKPLGANAPHAVRMQAEIPDLKFAAKRYSQALPPALDLLILGVGDDGHICSLFPGHAALRVADTTVTVIEDSPKPPPRRMTLTLPYVVKSRRLWIVAVGERKRLLLQRAISREEVMTPIDLVIAQSKAVSVFTDQAIRR
jgi:6-phosphogluconolactonase